MYPKLHKLVLLNYKMICNTLTEFPALHSKDTPSSKTILVV